MKENLEKLLKNLGININIEGIGVDIGELKSAIKFSQDESSNILQISIDPRITKDQIKAHLVEPGTICVEWPKIRPKGEEIPVQ
jgi:hypothetical protein